MKKLAAFLVVIAVVAGAYLATSPDSLSTAFTDLLVADGGEHSDEHSGGSTDAAPTGIDQEAAAASASAVAPVSKPLDATAVTVDYVHDGDTLFVVTSSGERLKVRLIGIDTPEVGDNAECFGSEATARARALMPEGMTAWVTADAGPLDQYGRSLLYLWSDSGEFVNLTLVSEGYATPLSIAPNVRYEQSFATAASSAQAGSAGLWGAC